MRACRKPRSTVISSGCGRASTALREAYATGTLPVLRVPDWRDDIAPARDALAALSKDARTLVFFGTGGSSLGGQALAQLGGWGIPGDDGNGGTRPPAHPLLR